MAGPGRPQEKPKLSLKGRRTSKAIDPEDVEAFGNQAPTEQKKKPTAPKKKQTSKSMAKAAPVPSGKTALQSYKLFEDEVNALKELVVRSIVTTRVVYSKTDIIRAGIIALTDMTDKELSKVLGKVRQTKPGPAAAPLK